MTVFGPKRYDRYKGAPNLYTGTFERCNPSDLALLRVTNGNGKDTSITSGKISINGTVIVDESDFKQKTFLIEKTIFITQMNELKVELKSSSRERSFVIVEIIGRNCDSTPPVIFAPSPGEGALLPTPRPTITASYRDEANGSGIDPASASLTVDGADVTAAASGSANGISYLPAADLPEGEHTVSLTVADRAANSTNLVWHFTTDTIAPVVAITAPVTGLLTNNAQITVSGTLSEEFSVVTVNDVPAAVTGKNYTCALTLAEGANTLTARATDGARNGGSFAVSVNLDSTPPAAPVLASLNTPTNVSTVTASWSCCWAR